MRELIDKNLRLIYGVDFDSIQKQFTIVTDGEASMVRMETARSVVVFVLQTKYG